MIGVAIRIAADLRFQPLVLALANIRHIDSIRSRSRRFVQLSDDARRKVVYQAWWLECGNTVATLPISLTACLLGRKTPQQLSGCATAIHMDGRITCGLSTVWKTGGYAIISLMRQIVSADDLALRDLVERDVWNEHIIRNLIVGHDLRSAVPYPSIWRSGHELPLEEAEQIIADAREKWQPADIRLRWTLAAEDELAAHSALRTLPRYHRWLAWRSPSGLSEPGLTAADVVFLTWLS